MHVSNLVTNVMDDDVNDAMVKDINASLKLPNRTKNHNPCLHCLQLMFQNLSHGNFQSMLYVSLQ